MAQLPDNLPNTRERIAARRRSKAANASTPQPQRTKASARASAPKSVIRQSAARNVPQPTQWAQPAARRAPRGTTAPGPSRVAFSWISSGRIGSAAVLVGALIGFSYIFTNPRYTIQDVQVNGTEVLNASDIIKLADAKDQSIWYLDTATMIEKIKANPYVADASASVALPGTLLLNVVERRPELRWASGSEQFFVERTGRVLGLADTTGTLTNTLVIDDRSARVLKPNDYVDRDALSLAGSLALRLTNETGVKPLSISWAQDKGIYVLAPDNKTIIFGKSERLDEKLTVLDSLLKQGTVFTILDLRPKTPFYRNESGSGG